MTPPGGNGASVAPPQSIEVEQALLGAILNHEDALRIASEHVLFGQFAEPFHQLIFKTCGDLASTGKPITPVSVIPYMPSQDIGGMTMAQYVIRLYSDGAPVSTVAGLAKIVADLAIRRALIEQAQEAIARASAPDPNISALKILEDYEGSLAEIRVRMETTESGSISLSRAIEKLFKAVDDKRKGLVETTVTTGFRDLDRKIGGGWRAGHLYLAGARPGMGKTSLMTASARRCARKGNGVGLLCLEIDEEQTAARFLASGFTKAVDPMNYGDILSGDTPIQRDSDLGNMARHFEDYPIEIDCTSGIDFGAIESRAKSMAAKLRRRGFEMKVLYVDYLGLIALTRGNNDSKASALGDLVLALRNMARRLGFAVVLFAQLNRGLEAREDKRPTKEDFRDSGNIEEHADVIMGLYRPAVYDEPLQKLLDRGVWVKVPDNFANDSYARRRDLEVILDKNRFGPRDTVILYCDIARALIDDADKVHEAPLDNYAGGDL